MKELIENPANVVRLWNQARGYVGMSDEQVTAMAEDVLRDMTPADLDRPRPAQQPVTETLVDPDDAVEHYERFE
jgi:hypothetical protein